MAKKAKFKRVAVAGQTTDGRTIAPEWLTQAAKNYNREKYGARVNLEHYLSPFPDSDFRAYGDVISVYAEEVEIDGEKKMALFADIDPTEDLIKLNKARQKVYTSVELDLDFAGTGEAYLVGLAVTNTPASLGTEYLQFCAGAGDKSPLAARKQKSTNLFTCAIETEVEFTEEGDKAQVCWNGSPRCSPATRSNPPPISATCTRPSRPSRKRSPPLMPACRRSSPSRPRPSPS